ncbi:hypothetical protein Q3G72_009230 [Acer saccharum]|nr:hypothetical protein Q3G72_009230 [Acer saccharum]
MPKVAKLKLFLSTPLMVPDLDTGHLRFGGSRLGVEGFGFLHLGFPVLVCDWGLLWLWRPRFLLVRISSSSVCVGCPVVWSCALVWVVLLSGVVFWEFSWICGGGELDLGSFCIQRAIIDVINLVFLCVFYLSLLVGSINKHHIIESHRRNWFSVVVSICCALVSIAYFGNGLWILISKTDGFDTLSWLSYIIRGLIWISLAFSLLVKRSKWIKILISLWWVSFSLLICALSVEILAKTRSIRVFDILPLPVNLLLLFCAFRNFSHVELTEDNSLSEPLLVEKAEKNQTKLGNSSFLSKLAFSWINPLLSLGYSKPLVLEDIPSLVPEDEADLAYQKFAHAWDSLVREKKSNDTGNLVLRAIRKVYLKENIFIASCALLRTIAVVVLPLLLYAFVNYSNRDEENLREAQFKKAYGTVLYWMSPTIISSVIFLGCALFKSAPLNASTIFTVLATLRSMGEPVRMIPEALSIMIQVKVSFDRINKFLLDDELKNDDVRRISMQKSDRSVKIQEGNFSWDPELTIPTLRDVNLEVEWGQKTAVCGSVGAGKSSLLYAILGEIPKISGTDCVMTALGTKTVILVTHQVEFLSEVDKILVLEGGKVTQSGSYQELLLAGTAFEQLVNAHRDAVTVLGPSNNEGQEEAQKGDKDQIVRPAEPRRTYLVKENSEGEISAKGLPGIQLTEEEEKGTGDVGWKPFLDYLLVSKGTLVLCLGILAQCGFVSLQAASTYWLAYAIQIPNVTSGLLIGVYTGVSTLSAVFVYFRSFYAAQMGLKASKAFFSGFMNSIFKAPMLFFDSTPVGRILTRASSDLSVLDFDIPFSILFVVAASVELLVTIGIMTFVTWQVLIVAILAMVAVKYVQEYYIETARELIRINGTTKAPVMNYTAETSLGVVTIRAFNVVDRFFQNYLKLVDTDAILFFHSNGVMEWLVLRIEAIQNLTLFTAALLLVLMPKGYVAPGLVGLSLSYAFSLTGTQVFMSRWYCYLSNYIISVERIKQFMNIPPEPPAIVEDNRPPSSWPSKGRIELQELKALEKCQLKTTISSLPNKLDSSGKLLEYDEPSKLMETNSSFSKLVAEYWSSCKGNSYQNLSNIK